MSFTGKFFVFLVGLAVLAVVGAWIMGGESVKHSTSISIDARPSSVFRYLTDGEKIKQWASDVVSVGSFGDDSEEGRRTQDRIIRDKGEEVVWEDSLMRFQVGNSNSESTAGSNYAVSIQSRRGGLTRTYVYQLEENDIGGTNLTYRITRSASGLDQFLFPFQEDETDIKMAAEMTRLKKLIESEIDPSDMQKRDPIEEDAPLVAFDTNGNNEPLTNSDPPVQPTSMENDSVVDQVMGSATPEPVKKQALGERNFESLFGTGLPK